MSTSRSRHRLLVAYRANEAAPLEIVTMRDRPPRRTCFECGARRRTPLLITLGSEEFGACSPCTDRILGLSDEAEARD